MPSKTGTVFDQFVSDATPTTPLPVQKGKSGTVFDSLEEKPAQLTPPTGADSLRMGGKAMKDVLVNNAPDIGMTLGGAVGTFGGPEGTVAGAGVGMALGQAIKDQIAENEGAVPMSGTEAARSMEGAFNKGAFLQYLTPVALRGLAKLGSGIVKGVIGVGEGVAPELFPGQFKGVPGVPAAPLPGGPMPPVPPGLAQASSVARGAAGAAEAKAGSAGLSSAVARVEAGNATEAQESTAKALQQSLDFLPDPGTLGTGQEVQSGLRTGADIWHREGGVLYDKSKALTRDIQIPNKELNSLGTQLAREKSPETIAFSQSGGYTPKIQKIVDDLTSLGTEITDKEGNVLRPASDTTSFQALDGYRQTLQAISQDRTDPLAATQAQGILKKVTGLITDVMSKDLAGTPEGQAWEEARKFWKEGAAVFDHAVMTKAVNANPEDVLAMLKPASGVNAASITEAQQFRTGLIDYIRVNGTSDEVAHAEKVYNTLLNGFTQRNLGINGDVTALPGKLAGYKDVMKIIYDGTAEGRTLRQGIEGMSNAVSETLKKNSILTGAEKDFQYAYDAASRAGASAEKAETAGIAAAKSVQDKNFTNLSEAHQKMIVKAEQDIRARVKRQVASFVTMAAVATGFSGHGLIASAEAGAGIGLADSFVDSVIRNRKASGIWDKLVAQQVDRAIHPPNISLPKDLLTPTKPAALFTSLANALRIGNMVYKETSPFGPMPTRKTK